MRLATLALVLAGIVVGGVAAFAQRPASAALPSPEPGSLDAKLVQRGAELAALGNCASCHTAPGGRDFAGGFGVQTPFGTIYSSNITPDPETGIGHWSPGDFIRAMRKGVDPAGRHLYPAFPYDHFTLVTDDDDHALYAFLMSREPAHATTTPNRLAFPLSVRAVMTGWNWLFLREGPFTPDKTHDAAWNRGAYLVEGLGHCGACHTPHNMFGAEKSSAALAGAPVEGWYAVALNAESPAPVPWTKEALAFYLKHGWAENHGVARGPMVEVTSNLASVPYEDVAAMATYLVDRMGPISAAREQHADALLEGQGVKPAATGNGAAIYQGACAGCHEAGRPLPFGGMNLAFSSGVSAASPANVINLVLNGLPAAPGSAGPIMPGFRGVLTDAQMADLLGFLRDHFSDKPAWSKVDDLIRTARREGG